MAAVVRAAAPLAVVVADAAAVITSLPSPLADACCSALATRLRRGPPLSLLRSCSKLDRVLATVRKTPLGDGECCTPTSLAVSSPTLH